MTNPLVSIITPCYNGERFVHRFLDSVLRQTYDKLELIFVDDGSTDGTARIIREYADAFREKGIPLIYLYQENAGQAEAVNQGMQHFRGDYLMFSDSDDWLSDDCVEKKLTYLQTHPDKMFVLGRAVIVEEGRENTVIHTFRRENTASGWLFDDLMFERDAYYAPGSYMFRTEAFLKVLPSRHIYSGSGGQNWQLLLPMAYQYECGFLDDVLYYILARQDSHSRALPTYEALYTRSVAHEDTLNAVIDTIGMPLEEQQEYRRKIRLKYAYNRFWLAVEHYNVVAADEQYAAFCTDGKPGGKMKLVHFFGRSKLMLGMYNSARNIRNKLFQKGW